MNTEERIAALERRVDQHDKWITQLILYAKRFPGGRAILKAIGLGG